MKKFIAILFMMVLSCDMAFAGTVVVKYNNAGAATRHQYGAGIHQKFGRNAIYAPHTNQMIVRRNRQRKLENAIINSLNNRGQCCYRNPMMAAGTSGMANTSVATSAPISRFDKNYTIKSSPKTRTVGGVTYYN